MTGIDLKSTLKNQKTVKHLLESAGRLRSGPVHKKYVIDSDMLQTLCGSFSDSNDVITLSDLAIILIGCAGFMRFNNLSSLLFRHFIL